MVEQNPTGRRSSRMRLRAAWMYYVEEMTQSDIADVLGVGRVTIVRLLADARALNEVRISVSRDLAELPRLEMGLQKRFGLKEAIVAPFTRHKGDPTRTIGAAAGPVYLRQSAVGNADWAGLGQDHFRDAGLSGRAPPLPI